MAAARWLFSGSNFGRAEECPPSAAFSGCDTATTEQRDGTDGHEFMALIVEGMAREDALARVAETVREWVEKIAVALVPRGDAEVALAWNHRTGFARRSGDKQRRYELREHEIPMTLDFVRYDPESRHVRVIDWKFVQFDLDVEDYRAQLEIGCLAAATEAGARTAEAHIGVVTRDGALGWVRVGEYDRDALREIAARARRAVRLVEERRAERAEAEAAGRVWTPDVRQGAHCRYCPGFFSCPAKRAQVAMALAGAPVLPDGLADAYAAVQTVEKWAGEMRKTVKQALVHRGGMPLPSSDGREVALQSNGAVKLRRIKKGKGGDVERE